MTDVATPNQLSPKDLYTYEGPLYVENRSHSKIFHDDGKGNQLELGPVTSESRFNVLAIEIAKSSTFQKVWRQGMVRVSTDPEMEAVLILSDHRQIQMEADRVKGIEAMIDTSVQDRSLVQIICLECKKDAFQSNADIAEGAPPLCRDHKPLSGTWVSTQEYDQTKGETKIVWSKVRIEATKSGLPAKE